MLRYKFRPQHRLKSPKEFQSVFDQNEFRVGSPAILVLAKTNDLEYARLGLVMRKKFVRHAHDRNRIKRVVRESFRHLQSILQGMDCVVLTRPGAGEMPVKELRKLIDDMFETIARKRATNTSATLNTEQVANEPLRAAENAAEK